MPRTSRVQITSAVGEIQKQARQLLGNLSSQIRSKKADLRRLKEAESTLLRLTGWRATSGNRRVAGRGGGG
jgi:hypothetical protein